MLTIFATPKPFRGHVGSIQRDAIRSWTVLRPRPEIILIGDDEGTEEVCAEYGLRWIAHVERSENGIPLTASVFSLGQSHATYPIVCYTNADVLYGNDFLEAVRGCTEHLRGQPYLLIGGVWNVRRIPHEALERWAWETELKALAAKFGSFDGRVAMEYFVFPREVRWDFPRLIIGRAGWDSWIPYQAHKRDIPVVDIGHVMTAIHQDHAREVYRAGKIVLQHHSPEDVHNLKLLGFRGRYWIGDARYRLTAAGTLEKLPHPRLRWLLQRLFAVRNWLVYELQHRYWPLFVLLRGLVRISRAAARSLDAAIR